MNTKKILVVEDDRMVRKALKKRIEKEGFVVLVAEDGAEGLKVALDEQPDLILLDIMLPIMDGMTLLEKLRQDSWGGDVPVIVLSNLSKAAAVNEGKSKGIKDYLVKTNWRLEDIIKKVKQELN